MTIDIQINSSVQLWRNILHHRILIIENFATFFFSFCKKFHLCDIILFVFCVERLQFLALSMQMQNLVISFPQSHLFQIVRLCYSLLIHRDIIFNLAQLFPLQRSFPFDETFANLSDRFGRSPSTFHNSSKNCTNCPFFPSNFIREEARIKWNVRILYNTSCKYNPKTAGGYTTAG